MSSVDRVRGALREYGLDSAVRELPQSARTAALAAAALGCDLGAIVKSLLFLADGRAALALVAGDRRADPARLRQVLGAGPVVLAGADVVRAETGFAIGGVPPVGHRQALPVVVDASLDALRGGLGGGRRAERRVPCVLWRAGQDHRRHGGGPGPGRAGGRLRCGRPARLREGGMRDSRATSWLNMGAAAVRAGDVADARFYLERALISDPGLDEQTQIWYWLSRDHRRPGREAPAARGRGDQPARPRRGPPGPGHPGRAAQARGPGRPAEAGGAAATRRRSPAGGTSARSAAAGWPSTPRRAPWPAATAVSRPSTFARPAATTRSRSTSS